MSLAELKGTPKASTFKKAVPTYSYMGAVAQVRTAKKGTVISRAETRTSIPTVPKAVTSPIEFLGALSNIYKGTKEGYVKGAAAFMPYTIVTKPAYDIRQGSKGEETARPFVDVIAPRIDEMKEKEPGAKNWWESPVVPGYPTLPDITLPEIKLPEIKLPDIDILGGLKEAGKWLLIGGIGLIAILILTRRD